MRRSRHRQGPSRRPSHPPSPRPPPPPVVESDDYRVFLDLLWIAFTVCVAVVVGKAVASSTSEDIIEFVEGDKFYLGLSLLVSCLSVITIYGYVFWLQKRYEVLVDLALDYAIAAQNRVRQFRGSFFWLRSLMAVFEPSPENFVRVNKLFKSVFLFGLCLTASLTGALLCTHKDSYADSASVNFLFLGLYYTFVYSPHETRFQMLIAHLGYTFLHSGILLAYYHLDLLGYILVNSGLALFGLCVVWIFVNVPRN